MSFETLRDPETHAKAHRALVMHYLQGGKTSEELLKEGMLRTLNQRTAMSRRFTDDDILDIRVRHRTGETQQAIANDYGVVRSTIGHIIQGRIYRHVPESEAAA
jgi:hypothetical protein